MIKYNIRDATKDDFIELTGKPNELTVKAWAVEYDGELACVAGVTINRDNMVFFSDIRKDRSYPKMTIFKIACYIVDQVADMNLPLVAVGDNGSNKFLEALGFIYTGDYQGQRIYQLWQN